MFLYNNGSSLTEVKYQDDAHSFFPERRKNFVSCYTYLAGYRCSVYIQSLRRLVEGQGQKHWRSYKPLSIPRLFHNLPKSLLPTETCSYTAIGSPSIKQLYVYVHVDADQSQVPGQLRKTNLFMHVKCVICIYETEALIIFKCLPKLIGI